MYLIPSGGGFTPGKFFMTLIIIKLLFSFVDKLLKLKTESLNQSYLVRFSRLLIVNISDLLCSELIRCTVGNRPLEAS